MPQSRGFVWKLRQTRISRLVYLKGSLLSLLCAALLAVGIGLIFAVLQIGYEAQGVPQQGTLFDAVSALGTALPNLIAGGIVICLFVLYMILTIERLHDLGHSGWLSLISFIPLLNILLWLFLLFAAGELSPNRFGPPPS